MQPLIALVVKADENGSDRRIQSIGRQLADRIESDPAKIMVIHDGGARASLYNLFAGYSSTAIFAPEQVRRAPELCSADPPNFNSLLKTASDARLGQPPKTPTVVVALADRFFVTAFIRHCMVLGGRGDHPSLDDFVRTPGTLVVIDPNDNLKITLQQ